MSSLKVEVCKVLNVESHPGADKLDLISIKGWTVVEKKGRFKVGDLVVYCPPESVLPKELSDRFNCTQYLVNQRIKTAKLRGIISYGLIIPNENNWPEDTDLTEYYGIIKYEPPEPKQSSILGGQNIKEVGPFHCYTHIENWNNYPDVLIPEEEVIITEKTHGCLHPDTKIRMADNSIKKIKNISVGDEVIGVNNCGKIVASKVTKIFNNGKSSNWLKIKGTRKLLGKFTGSKYFTIICTPEHRFFSEGHYKPIRDLGIGSKIYALRQMKGLTPIQEQVILGKLLGDGSLRLGQCSASLEFGHSKEQSDYLEWTCKALGYLDYGIRYKVKSGYGSDMIRTRTIRNGWLKSKFSDFIVDGIKVIPSWVADEITPIALAFLYMDDGSLSHHESQEDRASFALCNFTQEDCLILMKGLLKFGIQSVYCKSSNKDKTKTHSRLRLNKDDADKLWLLIAPYIPESMQYKLPERYRGHKGWMPEFKEFDKPLIVEQEILSIEFLETNIIQYDLETETHNYFASGVLVHNSNWRTGLIEDNFYVGSRFKNKAKDEKVVYWEIALRYNIEELMKSRLPKGFNWILFGEIAGKKIQDLDYGLDKPELFLFDISCNGRYLDYDEFEEIIKLLELPIVPLLYRGKYDINLLKDLSTGQAFQGDHIKEGTVIRPIKERWEKRVGRVILKKINGDYLIRKHGSEYH